MAQQQINPDPTQLDLNAILDAESKGDLSDDEVSQIAQWRAQGSFPPPKAKYIPPPPTAYDYIRPKSSFPVAGAMIGGAAGGATNFPGARVIGTGAGQALGDYLGNAAEQKTWKPEGLTPVSNFLGGAIGEGVLGTTGKLLTGGFRKPMTPIGKETYDLIGDRAMIPDLTDAPGWGVAREIAREGFSGKTATKKFETQTGKLLLNKATDEAAGAMPSYTWVPPASRIRLTAPPALDQPKAAGGSDVQWKLKNVYDSGMKRGKSLFENFMSQYGDKYTPVEILDIHGNPTGMADPNTTVPVAQLAKMRTQAFEDARAAAAVNDETGKRAATVRAAGLRDRIAQALDNPRLMQQFDNISDEYGRIAEKVDNPAVRGMREHTDEESVIDEINSSKFNTFPPFRDMRTVPNEAMPVHKRVSQKNALQLIQEALGDTSTKRLKSDAILGKIQDSVKTTSTGENILDGPKFVESMSKLPEQVQEQLFGKGTAKNLNQIAQVAKHTQEQRGGTGALWIVMRQSSAILGLGTAAYGMATGNPQAGILTGGTIILSPAIFSALLRSPTWTKLFVETANATVPNIKQTLFKHLIAAMTRAGVAEETQHLQGNEKANIPQPPQSGFSTTIPPK